MNFKWRQRLNISRLAIRYPVFTLSFWLAIMIAGLLAFSSLKYALFPDVTFPVVIIRVSGNYENVMDTSNNLTLPLSQPLLSLDSLESVSSTTFPNEAVINTLFYAGETLDSATEIIKNAIAPITLPENTKLEIIPYNLNESSAISYALTSDTLDLGDIVNIANAKIIPSLKNINGILKVNLWGVNSDVDGFNSDNFIPSMVNHNGQSAIALQIIKRGDGNTLEVVKSVKSLMATLQPQLNNLNLHIAQTEADYIQTATHATIDSLILAIILAILIIYPFLQNFWATFITAIAIPLSLCGTFIVMAIAHFNLETITLLALALVMGIVVDDAIVETENISRYISLGYTPKQAALKGSDEIGLTVSASTLTIVAVFLPVAFMTGNVGQFFQPFALTISTAVMVSLLVARTLTPVLAIYLLKPSKPPTEKIPNQKYFNFGENILKKYRKLLIWSLSHRKIVIIGAIVSFILGLALIPLIPQGFIPQLDRGEFNIIYTTELPKIPQNWNINPSFSTNNEKEESSLNWLNTIKQNPNEFILRRTARMGKEIETVVLTIPEVETVFNIVGFRGQPNRGKIYIKLKSERQLNTFQVQDKIRDILPSLKGVDVSVEDIKFVDTGDAKPFSFTLVSDNLSSLYQSAEKVKSSLTSLSALQDLSISPADITLTDNQLPTTIEHLQGKQAVTFTANLGKGEALGDLTQEVTNIVQPLLSSDVSLDIGGDSARMGEVLRQFAISFVVSVLLMLLVLWLLFGSFLEPLIVGFSLPLSIVGAMMALLITQSDFGMISLMGVIFLLGLLDKNTLLLIDYMNQLRQQGKNRYDAVITGSVTRLRPILMTTLSTILGMLPIAVGFGAGAELRQPMAVAIIGGLITSSLLSLIFVPVFYTMVDDIWHNLRVGKN